MYLDIRNQILNRSELEIQVENLLREVETGAKSVSIEKDVSQVEQWLFKMRMNSFQLENLPHNYSVDNSILNDEQKNLKEISEKFLRSYKVNGFVIMCCISGSVAYNTQTESSRNFPDYLGVYVNLKSKFSMFPSIINIDCAGASADRNKKLYNRGITLIEISHFMRLLSEGLLILMIYCLYLFLKGITVWWKHFAFLLLNLLMKHHIGLI